MPKGKINNLLSGIKKGEIILLVSPSSIIHETDLRVLKQITSVADEGIYITISRPFLSLIKMLEDNKINTKKMFFIDLITATTSSNMERRDNCLFLSSPNNLTDLGIAIDQFLSAKPDSNKFIFIDNLTTFLIYNSESLMTEFVHYVINKMRVSNVLGVIMSVEEEIGSKLINTISSICDKVIKVGGAK